MESASNGNRRHFSRIPFQVDVKLHFSSEAPTCRLLDIALKGALVEAPHSLAVDLGDACRLEVPLGGEENIVMEGEVAHCEGNNIGIACRDIELDSMTNLRRLVELNLGDAGMLHRELSELLKHI